MEDSGILAFMRSVNGAFQQTPCLADVTALASDGVLLFKHYNRRARRGDVRRERVALLLLSTSAGRQKTAAAFIQTATAATLFDGVGERAARKKKQKVTGPLWQIILQSHRKAAGGTTGCA